MLQKVLDVTASIERMLDLPIERVNMIERIKAVLTDLQWILRTCRVASVFPIVTFEQALTLDGVAQVQAVRDGCAELRECIDLELNAGNTMCASYLHTAMLLVKNI